MDLPRLRQLNLFSAGYTQNAVHVLFSFPQFRKAALPNKETRPPATFSLEGQTGANKLVVTRGKINVEAGTRWSVMEQ